MCVCVEKEEKIAKAKTFRSGSTSRRERRSRLEVLGVKFGYNLFEAVNPRKSMQFILEHSS